MGHGTSRLMPFGAKSISHALLILLADALRLQLRADTVTNSTSDLEALGVDDEIAVNATSANKTALTNALVDSQRSSIVKLDEANSKGLTEISKLESEADEIKDQYANTPELLKHQQGDIKSLLEYLQPGQAKKPTESSLVFVHLLPPTISEYLRVQEERRAMEERAGLRQSRVRPRTTTLSQNQIRPSHEVAAEVQKLIQKMGSRAEVRAAYQSKVSELHRLRLLVDRLRNQTQVASQSSPTDPVIQGLAADVATKMRTYLLQIQQLEQEVSIYQAALTSMDN